MSKKDERAGKKKKKNLSLPWGIMKGLNSLEKMSLFYTQSPSQEKQRP